MAIYHFRHNKNKRSSGANVVNKVAYRLRTKAEFTEFETGLVKTRYHYNRDGEEVIDLGVVGAPDSIKDPLAWAEAIERSENRKNSVVCREFEVALPKELTKQEMSDAVKELIEKTITKYGMSAHAAIHYSETNSHAHILFSERTFDLKKNRFGNKSREYTKLGETALVQARECWADVANKYLKKHQIAISHKSFKDRNITELKPTQRVGHKHTSSTESIKKHNEIQVKKREELLKTDENFFNKYMNLIIERISGSDGKIGTWLNNKINSNNPKLPKNGTAPQKI
jgi:hypothetical protein